MSVKKSLWLASAFSVVFPFSVFASELVVPAGADFLVDKKVASNSYSRLVIGDDARLRLAPDVRFWTLDLETLEVGNNVKINASGLKGESGISGQHGSDAQEACQDGEPGLPGTEGATGQQGKSIVLRAKKAKIGFLSVAAVGGEGGNGGIGGDGGDGLSGNACKSGDAGSGGPGGDAGDGGVGGQIEFYLPESALDESNNIIVDVSGGSPGEPGAGGSAGIAGEGHYLNRATATGKKKWISAGDEGQPGEKGASAKAGVKGSFKIHTYNKKTGSPSSSAAIPEPEVIDISALKHRIEALEKRVQELESQ